MNSDRCQLQEILEGLAVSEKLRLYLMTAKGVLSAEVERVNARLVKVNDSSVKILTIRSFEVRLISSLGGRALPCGGNP